LKLTKAFKTHKLALFKKNLGLTQKTQNPIKSGWTLIFFKWFSFNSVISSCLHCCRSAAQAAKHSTQVYTDAKPTSNASAATKRSNKPYVDYFEMTD